MLWLRTSTPPDCCARRTPGWTLLYLGISGLAACILSAAVCVPRLVAEALPAGPAVANVDYAVTTEDLDQTWPVAVFNDNAGEYLVVYQHDYSTTNDDSDIHARRIGTDGSPAAGTFAVVETGWQELHPDIAVNLTNGEYLVVWEHVATASDHDIKAARVSKSGTPNSASPVAVTSTASEAYPAVTYNAARDEYLVVWQQPSADTHIIRGQRVDADGALLGSVFTVGNASPSLSSGTRPYQPDVAWDSVNDQYLVVWAKYSGSEYNIAAQFVDGDGSPSGDPLTIEDWQYDQLRPKLAYNAYDSEFMVVWEDHHWASGAARDIYGCRVEDNGTVRDRFGVAWGPSDSSDRINPVIAYKPAVREYMVGYEVIYYLSGHDIYRRRLDFSGALLEDEQIVINTGNDEQSATVAADDTDHYLIAWEDSRNSSSTEIDIYAARSPTGQFTGHVYNGTVWDSEVALPGATVQLYCSNSVNELGTLLESAVTDGQGSYHLAVVHKCEVWHLLENPPAGYDPVDSRTSTGGTKVSATYLRYVYPLDGATVLSGNDFLNTPHSAVDTIPPGGWASFSPGGWVNQQSVTAAIQVQDTGSGLNVGSAEFAYSTDGGATWGDWRPATCTGDNATNKPQVITAANVLFGQDSGMGGLNRIKFRIADTELGLSGVSPVYSVAIDSTAPPQPTGLRSTSHQTSIWSKDTTVDAVWNAVADNGSGLKGYSVEWSKAGNTTPDAFLDATTPSATSSALENSDLWYVHVRAVDNAGNLSATAHQGQFYIDALAPLTSVGFLGPNQGTLTFDVSWSEATTYGSPLTGYDIQVVDTWDGGSKTSTWKSNTLQTSATYTGVRGHTYAFYSRGRDAAGNQEVYPATPDATTTIGRDITVTVVDEARKVIPDAQTFFNGAFVGSTDVDGEWVAEDVLEGDEFVARLRIYSQRATKPDHNFPGLGEEVYWAWNAYITSVGFDALGNPQVFRVTDVNQSPTLTLRKSQALIGINFMVSIEWDADAAYLADLEQGLLNASAYLYDVTDGQMLLDTIVVWDNHAVWGPSDMHVEASNNIRPHARTNGITQGTTAHICVGRDWGGSWQHSFRTIVHEFGHYGLDLYDEYQDADGSEDTVATCATNPWSVAEERRASFMWHESQTTEMCSTVDPNHTHSTNTEQHAEHGECTWSTVQKKYDDNNQNDRWLILTPMDRGAVMPGPTTIPVADWSKVYLHDADTHVCVPFEVSIDMSQKYAGSRPTGADVFVMPKNSGAPSLYQGRPDAIGNITLYGAHDGDSLHVMFYGLMDLSTWPNMISTVTIKEPIHCATAAVPAEVQSLTPVLDAFSLRVTAAPITEQRVLVQVEATVPLNAPPTVQLWQAGVITPTSVTMDLPTNSAVYVGEARLDPSYESSGLLYVTARDKERHEGWAIHRFALTSVQAGDHTSEIYSDDGMARLTLRADSLNADAVLVVQVAQGGSSGGLALVSGPYTLGTGDVPLASDATVHMSYAPEAASAVHLDSLRLYQWNAQANVWVAQASSHDTTVRSVSAHVDDLGTFAILGQPLHGGRLHLPLVVRAQAGRAAQSGESVVQWHQFLPGTYAAHPSALPPAIPAAPVVDAHRDLPQVLYLPLVR